MDKTILLLTSNGMGKADIQLQQMLIARYLELLKQDGKRPAAICFYTEGVKLVCEGSLVIDQLRELETKGVRLLICNTCLDYFNLASSVRVGTVSGMSEILEAQIRAEKVITL